MTVTRADLLRLRVVEALSVNDIADRLGVSYDQAKHLLSRHAVRLPHDARLSAARKGKAQRARKAPSEAQKAWASGQWASGQADAPPAAPKPRVVGTDTTEMIARALAEGYPVTVLPPLWGRDCKKLWFGQEVG